MSMHFHLFQSLWHWKQSCYAQNEINVHIHRGRWFSTAGDLQSTEAKIIESIIQTCDQFWRLYEKEITIQWIRDHLGIKMNDWTDKLAKIGTHMLQENIPI